MSYTLDIYRGEVEPTESLPDFALFVCFFPHLVAGPIMRASTLLPQVTHPRRVKQGDWELGFYLVLVGLCKKIVIADNAALIANGVFSAFAQGRHPATSGAEVLVGIYAFSIQIYGDFSGYSSIARGISKWLGFELIENFRLPYLAVSPSDFWKRWHISLSSWLRDYLYIPLGGNRHGKWSTYKNLTLTMLLGGLWHGANWTFVAWGFFHGLLLSIYRFFGIVDPSPAGPWREKLHWAWRVVLMFHLVCISWVLFRAESFHMAYTMLVTLVTHFTVTPMAVASLTMLLVFALPVLLVEWLLDGEHRLDRLLKVNEYWRSGLYFTLVFLLLVLHAGKSYDFIYFQF
jgi:D-alanyl-lipoteichoic acid acyltransferase DltB (MBOAT superfamily)